MSRMKEKNLRRFVALYIAGSVALGGVAYAEVKIANGDPVVVETGDIYDAVIGGGENKDVQQSNITVNGGTLGTDGQGFKQSVVGGGSAIAEAGGSKSSNVGTATVNINSGTFKSNIYGGGIASGEGNASAHVNEVKMNIGGDAEIGGGEDVSVYAGGSTNGMSAHSSVDKVTVTLSGNASITGSLNGGGDGNTTVGESNIIIEGAAKVKMGVAGGGNASNNETSTVRKSTITVNDGTIYGVGGGGHAEGNGKAIMDESNININGGVIYSGVYGGASASVDWQGTGGAAALVKKSVITVHGGSFDWDGVADFNSHGTAVFAGGRAQGAQTRSEVENVTLNIANVMIARVYGGGEAIESGVSHVGQSIVTVGEGAKIGTLCAGGKGETATVANSTINISGGKISGDVLRGNATKAALNFTAGTGSTIGGAVSGFDAVTVANGAKTDWTGENLTHTFGSLTVAEGGTINIGKAMTFDFRQVPSAASYSKMARAVQNGNFNVNGSVNLAKGSTLTMQNGIVTTSGKGAFFSEVDKEAIANSGKVAWGSNAQVKDDLHIGFSNLTNAELGELGKTDDFKNLVDNVADTGKLADGQRITNAKGSITDFEIEKTATGTKVITGPHTSASGVATYTGVRQGSVYISHNIVANIHEHTAGLRNGEKANEFWAGIRGGSTDVKTSFGETKVNTQYYQLGYDWDFSSNNQKAAIGLYFIKIAGDSTHNGFKNDIGSAYDFGIYGTKELGGGNYMSLIGRYGQIGNSLHTDVQTTEWKDKGYGLSMEFGNRNTQANGLMLEPYIQFNYNHYSAVDFNVGADQVGLDSGAMLDGKLGLRLIKQVGGNPNSTIYGGIAYTRGLSGDFTLKNRTNGEKLGGVDNDANAFELSIGANRQISKCSTINLNAKKEFGDYDGWSVQGMVNVNF